MSDRLSEITDAIWGNTQAMMARSSELNEAKAMVGDLSREGTNAREELFVTLADMSATHHWTKAEIEAAAAQAVARNNDERRAKSLGVIIGEARRAMDPLVRKHVPALRELRDRVWEEETEQKDGPRPCNQAFKRGYHMLIRMFSEGQEGRVFQTDAEVVGWANQRNVDTSPVVAAKALNKVRGKLAEIARTFPMRALQEAEELLDGIEASNLSRARDHARGVKPATDKRLSGKRPAYARRRTSKATVTAQVAPEAPSEPEHEHLDTDAQWGARFNNPGLDILDDAMKN